MASSLLQTLPAFIATWIAWRLLKCLRAKNQLATVARPPTDSFLAGNLVRILDPNGWDYMQKTTDAFGLNANVWTQDGAVFRFTGLFKKSGLFVYDPKALHHVAVKDQNLYEETNEFLATITVVFGMGLLSSVGEHHRKQRKLLNPVFSIAHLRGITPTFFDGVEKLRQSLTLQVAQGPKEIDILSWMSRASLELIGQCGFGYSFDSLEEGGDTHPFSESLRDLNAAFKDPGIQVGQLLLLPYVYKMGSPDFRRAVFNLVPWKMAHKIRDMVDVMHNTSIEIFEQTKRSLDKEDSNRTSGGKDAMSILLKANMATSEEDRLPDSEIIAQISTLTFAAMDTTANALARIFQLLTEHPEVQDKLRQEICDAHKEHGEERLDYDTLSSLPFLDAICRETLRLFPPLPYPQRRTLKDTVLPLSKPIISTEGKPLTEIFVPKGTPLILSVNNCNRDPDIWGPDSLEWKPERWLSPLPASVPEARISGVYSNLMSFGGGNRACIGFKISQLEMKVVLYSLLQTLKVSSSGRKVEWLSNAVVQPTTEDAELTPSGHKVLQLPLNVSLV